MTRLLLFTKRLLWASVIVGVLVVGALAYISPETDTYSSNIDDAPMVTRTLVPRETTTTTTTTAPQVTVELDEVIVIDGTRVLRLPRTSNVMLYLWLATYAYQ